MFNNDIDESEEIFLEQEILFLRYFGQAFQNNNDDININIIKILQKLNKNISSVKELSYLSNLSEGDIQKLLAFDVEDNK